MQESMQILDQLKETAAANMLKLKDQSKNTRGIDTRLKAVESLSANLK